MLERWKPIEMLKAVVTLTLIVDRRKKNAAVSTGQLQEYQTHRVYPHSLEPYQYMVPAMTYPPGKPENLHSGMIQDARLRTRNLMPNILQRTTATAEQ